MAEYIFFSTEGHRNIKSVGSWLSRCSLSVATVLLLPQKKLRAARNCHYSTRYQNSLVNTYDSATIYQIFVLSKTGKSIFERSVTQVFSRLFIGSRRKLARLRTVFVEK